MGVGRQDGAQGGAKDGLRAGQGRRTTSPEAERLEPLLAGAWARGLFDALEMMSHAAVLLDHEGRALAVTSAARRFVGRSFAVAGGRPVCGAQDDSRRLQEAILAAFAGRESRFVTGSEREPLALHVRPAPSAPGQMLAAILLIQNDEYSRLETQGDKAAAPCLRPAAH